MSSCCPDLGSTVNRFIKPTRHVNTIFLHCTASSNPKVDAFVVHDWHIANGWSCIGYHFLIKTNGTVQYGRDLERTPAAQSGYNSGSIAICLNGFYEKDFTVAQKEALIRLCDEINIAYDGIRFRGHKEVAAKDCPVFPYQSWLQLDSQGYMPVEQPALPSDTFGMVVTRVTLSQTVNDYHPDVWIAQGLLAAAGHSPGKIDGIFGPATTSAVKELQRTNGLMSDGVINQATWELLEACGK